MKSGRSTQENIIGPILVLIKKSLKLKKVKDSHLNRTSSSPTLTHVSIISMHSPQTWLVWITTLCTCISIANRLSFAWIQYSDSKIMLNNQAHFHDSQQCGQGETTLLAKFEVTSLDPQNYVQWPPLTWSSLKPSWLHFRFKIYVWSLNNLMLVACSIRIQPNANSRNMW